jgi:hypothetical protein
MARRELFMLVSEQESLPNVLRVVEADDYIYFETAAKHDDHQVTSTVKVSRKRLAYWLRVTGLFL